MKKTDSMNENQGGQSGNKKIFTYIIIFALIFIIASAVIFDSFFSVKEYDKTDYAMGSEISIKIKSRKNSDDLENNLVSDVKKLDSLISNKTEDTEISKLNKNGKEKVSDETLYALKISKEIAEKSGGALDATIGKVSELWDFDDEKNEVPSEDKIENALKTVDFRKITIDGNTVSLGLNQKIDLGAAGKGYACDIIKKRLEKEKYESAVISVGGTVFVSGKNGGGSDFNIGIRTPEKNETGYFASLKVKSGQFISTSGNYEKSFEKDGKIYHHILSPKTGWPASSGLKSVTVVSDEGIISDCLSTACFVLGYEKSKSLLSDYGASAVFVTDENDILTYNIKSSDLKLFSENYSYSVS